MEGRLLLVGAVVACAALASSQTAHAYDDRTTHPALSDESVRLYNRMYPDDQVSEDERRKILEATTDEDIVPRPLNHLYDPVHRTGWTGKHAGWVPEFLTRLASLVALLPDEPLANVEWIDADAAQQAYGRYGGNRSWQAGLRALARGDQDAAYRSLGSALHLLQDAGVPDHARDDTHAHQVDFLTGDAGSPYEIYAQKYGVGTIGIADRIKLEGLDMKRYEDPSRYLEDNARFSAASFFSKDTVQDPRFPGPVVTREQAGIAYGKAADGQEVPLARRGTSLLSLSGTTSSLRLGTGAAYDQILEKQFRILAERTIILGAGMIRDFREEQARADEEVQADRQIWSFASELQKALGGMAGWVGEQAGRVYGWLDGAFTRVEEVPESRDDTASTMPAEVVPDEIAVKGPTKDTAAVTKKGKADAPPAASSNKDQHVAVVCPSTGPPEVVINEVAWMGTLASATDEWIELANRSDDAVVMEGWELLSADGGVYADLDGVTIPARGYGLLERTDDAAVPGIAAKALYKGGLTNAPVEGFSLELMSPGCGIVDELTVTSGWPAGDAASRRTMELKPAGGWQSSAAPGGTPGKVNSSGFKEAKQATSTVGVEADDDQDEDEDRGEEVFVIDPGRVTISEISASGDDAGDEFIELYNVENRPVSLEGWSLQYIASSTAAVAQKRDLPAEVIPAHGYYLVARQPREDGSDGYRPGLSPDFEHRTFTLSGLGASVALVRGVERIASPNAPGVVDYASYPRLTAHESYERAARTGDICVDPRPDAAGRYLGNGCDAQEWFVRDASEPQNTTSPAEPRQVAHEDEVEAANAAWLQVETEGYRGDASAAPDWLALAVVQGAGETAVEISTKDQLVPGGASTMRLEYRACSGARMIARVLLLPLTPSGCQGGGLLSGAYAGKYWEDGKVMVKALGSIAVGETLRIIGYAFSGGRGGDQYFTRIEEYARELVFSGGTGSAPEAPTRLEADLSAKPNVVITWEVARDEDNVDTELEYVVRITSEGMSAAWNDIGAATEQRRELPLGHHLIEVMARDEQGNESEVTSLEVDVEQDGFGEQLAHADHLLPGTSTLQLSRDVRLGGFALWVVPQGGPYCCANPIVRVSRDGVEIARMSNGRRIVDGEGEVEFRLEEAKTLTAGEYEIEVRMPESMSNQFWLGGKKHDSGSTGTGYWYLRILNA